MGKVGSISVQARQSSEKEQQVLVIGNKNIQNSWRCTQSERNVKGSEKNTTIFHFLKIDEKYENNEQTNSKDIKKKTC